VFEPTGLRISYKRIQHGRPADLVLRSLELVPLAAPRSAVVDPLGQRASREWPGKVHLASELKQRAQSEGRELEQAGPAVGLDAYLGWKGGPRFRASGFFRVEKDGGGRWWLVTPEGSPFWSIGTTGVRLSFPTDTALAFGREGFYATLPEPQDETTGTAWMQGKVESPIGIFELVGNVHYYRWNVLRKYGAPEPWRDRVAARFPAWGLNSIGAWSEEIILAQRKVPHTRFIRARTDMGPAPKVGGFTDVFDPRWEAALDAQIARETLSERGNPWLIGYFVDNEAHWSDLRLLDIAPEARLREAWVDFAKERHGCIENFNTEWRTNCADWAAVRSLTSKNVPTSGPGRAAMGAFEAVFAERYFATIARLLRKHDPEHLYLGCRFVRVPPAEAIVAAAGRHVDVLSVNCYARVPDPAAFEAWHRMSGGRPILIGEFHFPLESERQLPPLWQAFSEAERSAMFVEFVKTWAKQPWAVGCHWYQHADQPLLGRFTDGENQTVGFVDITDTPYEHLVRAAREASAGMYRWHTGD